MENTFIYTLSHPITDEIKYVGKSDNPAYRLINHCKDKRLTKNKSWILGLQKSGLKPKLEIIDEIKKTEWEFWEVYWISQMKAWGFKLNNILEGGNSMYTRKKDSNGRKQGGSKKGRKLSEETKEKMREARLGEKNPRFGRPHKKESIVKMKEKKYGDNNPNSLKRKKEKKYHFEMKP